MSNSISKLSKQSNTFANEVETKWIESVTLNAKDVASEFAETATALRQSLSHFVCGANLNFHSRLPP